MHRTRYRSYARALARNVGSPKSALWGPGGFRIDHCFLVHWSDGTAILRDELCFHATVLLTV
jgi:hypothetical protein